MAWSQNNKCKVSPKLSTASQNSRKVSMSPKNCNRKVTQSSNLISPLSLNVDIDSKLVSVPQLTTEAVLISSQDSVSEVPVQDNSSAGKSSFLSSLNIIDSKAKSVQGKSGFISSGVSKVQNLFEGSTEAVRTLTYVSISQSTPQMPLQDSMQNDGITRGIKNVTAIEPDKKDVSIVDLSQYSDADNSNVIELDCDETLNKSCFIIDVEPELNLTPQSVPSVPRVQASYTKDLTENQRLRDEPLDDNMDDAKQLDVNSNSCVSVKDESDSDIEFVESFNPSDNLIEISDSEDVIIVGEQKLPSTILLPKGNGRVRRKRKSVGPSSSNNTVKKRRLEVNKKTVIQKKTKAKNQGQVAKGSLRPIVIDGCNVGMGHSRSKMVSVEGLKICLDYFRNRGHSVKIFLPQSKKHSRMTTDNQSLVQMERDGVVVFTPFRKVDNECISSYDDRFIVQYAHLKGAIIITRDNYRDLLKENEEWRDTIKNRLLQYTFIDDVLMFPDDPLGKTGPRLDDFLRFPPDHQQQDASSSKTDTKS